MKNYFDLNGRVAIVTGCSTGLGVQMAQALANQGCNIVCLARRKAMVEENAAMLEVDPLPDTIVRVNMFFYASDEYVEIEKQDLTSMNPSLEEREGFVLVEWGGETV